MDAEWHRCSNFIFITRLKEKYSNEDIFKSIKRSKKQAGL
jgi:hypothetical protein